MRRARGPRSWRDSAAVDLPSSTLKSHRCRLWPTEQDRQRRTPHSVHRSWCHLHTRVAWDDDVWRAITVRQCTGETRSVQGPNLVGLQSRLYWWHVVVVGWKEDTLLLFFTWPLCSLLGKLGSSTIQAIPTSNSGYATQHNSADWHNMVSQQN